MVVVVVAVVVVVVGMIGSFDPDYNTCGLWGGRTYRCRRSTSRGAGVGYTVRSASAAHPTLAANHRHGPPWALEPTEHRDLQNTDNRCRHINGWRRRGGLVARTDRWLLLTTAQSSSGIEAPMIALAGSVGSVRHWKTPPRLSTLSWDIPVAPSDSAKSHQPARHFLPTCEPTRGHPT